jgi:hypothetical protein
LCFKDKVSENNDDGSVKQNVDRASVWRAGACLPFAIKEIMSEEFGGELLENSFI